MPRYTSYPTAPQFHGGITAGTYRDWLAGIGDGEPVSLYVHVPFCNKMCWFCACHTRIVRRYGPIGDYAALLQREISLVAEATASRPTVTHIHFGGGTPNMLSRDDFSALTATIRERFRLADNAEFAVEVDPRTLTEGKAAGLASCGVTRASLGVQDLNAPVQTAINRIQPYEMTARTAGWLRRSGIEAINIDLMYGLPHQTVEHVVQTVDLAVRLAPNRLAVFGYAHVPWMKKHQRMIDEAALPDPAERFMQAEAAAARLVEHGYRRIGLDHFARVDDPMAQALEERRLRRNFQGYTTDQAAILLGFGASAIGTLPQGYVQNASPLRTYAEAIRADRLSVVRGIRLGADDILRRAVIERLMCDLSVDLAAVCEGLGVPRESFAPELAALAPMERDGLIDVAGGRVTITEQGRPLVRLVCAVFDRYLKASEGQYSRAV